MARRRPVATACSAAVAAERSSLRPEISWDTGLVACFYADAGSAVPDLRENVLRGGSSPEPLRLIPAVERTRQWREQGTREPLVDGPGAGCPQAGAGITSLVVMAR